MKALEMKTPQESKKYWKKMQEQEKNFPNAHIYVNIKNMGVDMEKMTKTNPYLFDVFTRIFSGVSTPENIQLWKNYEQAYKDLESQGFFKFKNVLAKAMQCKIEEFVKKVDGPYLVPLVELEDVITEKKKKGEVSIQVEFNDYMELLEKYYEFDHRDFFNKFNSNKPDFAKLLELTPQEYASHYNMSPAQDLMATKIIILHDKYESINDMPSVDFWSHLLDHDFAEVSNGSIKRMWSHYEEKDQKLDGIKVSAIVFEKIRELMFKEIAQYPHHTIQDVDEIDFYIYW